jgi:hypothetical protein
MDIINETAALETLKAHDLLDPMSLAPDDFGLRWGRSGLKLTDLVNLRISLPTALDAPPPSSPPPTSSVLSSDHGFGSAPLPGDLAAHQGVAAKDCSECITVGIACAVLAWCPFLWLP